uniref:G_PROTEIN_RECEP_F1_2 domain-containing protein n=1 Tax=Haemonchus contortus TaxID=6289 RepID=A0A7I4YNR0_HAECO
SGFCDILGLFALEWTRAELKSSLGPDFELATRLMATMTGINFFTHILGCFLMTLNRFTGVCFPHQQHTIWCKRNVYLCIFVEIVVSILIHIEALTTSIAYVSTVDGGWSIAGRKGSVDATRVIGSILTLLYEGVSIMLISYTIYMINKQLRISGHRFTQDIGLLFVTIISCIMSIFECIYDVSFLFNFENSVILWIKAQYNINFFLVMTTNAWSIFFLSHSLRNEFLRRWRKTCRGKSNHNTTRSSAFPVSTTRTLHTQMYSRSRTDQCFPLG